MPQSNANEARHEIAVAAPADTVYRLIAEVRNWPMMFPPTIFVDQIEESGDQERIRIWATANGEAKTWVSRRTLDAAARRIEFRQEVSQPPVGSMGGTWIVEPVGDTTCRVVLLHDYRAVDDTLESLAWIERAVDRNSRAELAALKINAEAATSPEELLFTFADTVRVNSSAKDMYDFISDAHLWAERLPHVAKVSLSEDSPGLQLLRMDTRTKDGSVHTTESVRVCFPHRRIVYKQIVVPTLMTLHTGQWDFEHDGDAVLVTSTHTVILEPANVTAVLGEGAEIPQARAYVQKALSGNSLATLGYAKAYAEQR